MEDPLLQALPGMIGSLEEYASLVGTTVGKLAETRWVEIQGGSNSKT